MERSEQKTSRDKLYDFFYRLLLFSACNRSKQNAKVTGIGVGAYFFLAQIRVASSFHTKKDQMLSAKRFKISLDLKSFVKMGDACLLPILVSSL